VNEKPTHLDLFSGIGGFALAAGWAGFETVGFCEIEPYCQAVLKKHWPQVPIHRDIRGLGGGGQRIDLLTGGFPCQPFSFAGKRRGKDDDRYLWQEMFRIIKETNPAWIIGENVAGIINLGLQETITNLEAFDYEVRVFDISALSIDAVHKRERIWIVANSNGKRQNLWQKTIDKKEKQRTQNIVEGCSFREILKEWQGWKSTPYICRSDDGIPNRMDRIKGLGNAIVPQVAYQIIKGIRELI